jgi:transcriptional regulator with XRE-family HTH domain/quercetin dioxygenase-like cupin family protein
MERAPDGADVSARIGRRLADARAARNVGVSELARRISVSPSLISQIERGQSRPSVTTLFALATELGVPVDAFFAEAGPAAAAPSDAAVGARAAVNARGAAAASPADDGSALAPSPATAAWPRPQVTDGVISVLHPDRRPTIDIRGGVRWERLTPTALQGLDFMELVYQPGAESAGELYRHPGIEMVVVLENRIDIHVGFDVHVLEVGDSIAFPSSMPHRYVNPTEHLSRAVTVIVRDDVSALPLGHRD